MKPWSGENAAGRITPPASPQRHALFRHQHPDAVGRVRRARLHFAELDDVQAGARTERARPQGREGFAGRLCQYASRKTEQNDADGEDIEREIHFLKGYTVFNVEQIDGLPEHYYVKPEPKFTTVQRIDHAEAFFASHAS